MTEFGEGCRGDEARRVVWGGPRLEEGFEPWAKQLLLVLGAQGPFHREDRPLSQEAGAQKNHFYNEGRRRSEARTRQHAGGHPRVQEAERQGGEGRRWQVRDLVWTKGKNKHLHTYLAGEAP